MLILSLISLAIIVLSRVFLNGDVGNGYCAIVKRKNSIVYVYRVGKEVKYTVIGGN